MPLNSQTILAIWRRRGLRWGAAVAALLGACLLAMFTLVYWRGTVLLFNTLDRQVTEQLELLAARPPEMLPFMITSRMMGGAQVVTQVGLFSAARAPVVGDISAVPEGLAFDGRAHAVLAPGAATVHWRAAGKILLDGRVLIVARDASEILEVRGDFVRAAAAGIIPAILLCLGSGALVGVLSDRRLRRLNAVAERIIDGDLRQRLPANPMGDELDRLCAIVNRMLGRLEDGMRALSGVGENIAHDLRTPLTALRARLERTTQLVGADTPAGIATAHCIANVDQALSTITALLRIGDIQHGVRVSAFRPFDLAAIVTETAEIFLPLAEDRGVALLTDLRAPATILGDRDLMVEALVNLVDNALKFTPRGGHVTLTLAGTATRPELWVNDTGPGIPAASHNAVLHRFVRLDASRSTPGSGLGLSLVAAIAGLHRFGLILADNHPGCRVGLHCWPGSDGEGPGGDSGAVRLAPIRNRPR
jgi:signal transduction histidine kinase